MRTLALLTAALTGAAWCGPARADEGGYVDPTTDLVWSRTLSELTGGVVSRAYAENYAAGYAIWDVNEFGVPTLYDDWRLPTVAELQWAMKSGAFDHVARRKADGTIINSGLYHTSESKGKNYYYVELVLTPDRMAVDVAASGRLVVTSKTATYAVMVRP